MSDLGNISRNEALSPKFSEVQTSGKGDSILSPEGRGMNHKQKRKGGKGAIIQVRGPIETLQQQGEETAKSQNPKVLGNQKKSAGCNNN